MRYDWPSRGVVPLRDAACIGFAAAAFLVLLLTSPKATRWPAVQLFLALPLYVQITAVIFIFVTVASACTLVIRFFSQDWAGAKIRYEERRMQDEEGRRRG